MTQNEMVYEYMLKHGAINHGLAESELGITRLAARITDLRAGDWPGRECVEIEDRYISVRNRRNQVCRVKAYWLVDAAPVHKATRQLGLLTDTKCGSLVGGGYAWMDEKVTCPNCLAAEMRCA